MPVYEYRCDTCNIQFELRQKFSDPPADKCPKCSGTVSKLVSAASFSLKGGGWYGDGYGDKVEPTKHEGDTAVGAEPGTAETGTKTEGASTDTVAQAETAALPAAQASAPTQMEKKSTGNEKPTSAKDKAEIKSQVD